MKKIFLMFILFTGFVPLCLFADQSGLVEIKEIPKLDFKESKTITGVGEYNGHGMIDSVFEDRIVINDQNFFLSSNSAITKIGGHGYSGRLDKGMSVYYFLDKDGKIFKLVIDTDR